MTATCALRCCNRAVGRTIKRTLPSSLRLVSANCFSKTRASSLPGGTASAWVTTYVAPSVCAASAEPIASPVETLIEGADTQRLQLVAQLCRVRGHAMCVKGLLVLPRFQKHEMV